MKKFLAILLSLLMVLSLMACGKTAAPGSDGPSQPVTQTDGTQTPSLVTDGAELGEGSTTFTLKITDGTGKEISAAIHTDKKTVGEALQAMDIIAGEEGAYGLYLKTVNGETVDYDKDGAYWAFYINGEYAMTGIDVTEVEPDAAYALVVEKAS